MSNKSEHLAEIDPDILTIPGGDAALIGVCCRCGQRPFAVYDFDKLVEVLMESGATREQVREYIAFNIEGAWVGDYTPAIIRRLDP